MRLVKDCYSNIKLKLYQSPRAILYHEFLFDIVLGCLGCLGITVSYRDNGNYCAKLNLLKKSARNKLQNWQTRFENSLAIFCSSDFLEHELNV